MSDLTQINAWVQQRYDELMREGKHGHYESMFKVVHEAIEQHTHPRDFEWRNFLSSLLIVLESFEPPCWRPQMSLEECRDHAMRERVAALLHSTKAQLWGAEHAYLTSEDIAPPSRTDIFREDV